LPQEGGGSSSSSFLSHLLFCFATQLRRLGHSTLSRRNTFSHKLSKNLKMSLSDIMPSTRLLPASTMNTRRTPIVYLFVIEQGNTKPKG
jgi:hypothetical protein